MRSFSFLFFSFSIFLVFFLFLPETRKFQTYKAVAQNVLMGKKKAMICCIGIYKCVGSASFFSRRWSFFVFVVVVYPSFFIENTNTGMSQGKGERYEAKLGHDGTGPFAVPSMPGRG